MARLADMTNPWRNLTLPFKDFNWNLSQQGIFFNGSNDSMDYPYGMGNRSDIEHFLEFESTVRILIPIIFGCITVLGLVGNALVIFVVLSNQQMRSTTNILIVSLAFADLFFIVFCVPFTATGYALTTWPFGVIWCKIVQYFMFVCAYVSIYSLVLMSLDRYLAVVHPISSMSIRTQLNTYVVVFITWMIILLGHIPLLLQYGIFEYQYYVEDRSTCINLKNLDHPKVRKLFYASFFVFGYLLPLSLICVLYGFMLKRLLYGVVPGGSQRAESIRSKKRVTRMVVIVVVIFALCWLPIQIIFMVQNFGVFEDDIGSIAIQFAANCLAYMNSCVNPILYAFLSENFRRSFKKLLCCGSVQYTKFEYEKTNIRHNDNKEPVKTYTQSTNTTTTALQTYMNNGSNCSKNGSNKSNEAVNHCAQTDL